MLTIRFIRRHLVSRKWYNVGDTLTLPNEAASRSMIARGLAVDNAKGEAPCGNCGAHIPNADMVRLHRRLTDMRAAGGKFADAKRLARKTNLKHSAKGWDELLSLVEAASK